MNKVIVSGRLGKDPELTKTQSGLSLCNFSIAIDEYHKNEDEPTTWLSCQAWRQQADYIVENINKGDKVFIEGRIKQDTWQDNGQTRYKTYLVVERLEHGQKASKKSTGATSVKVKDIKQEDYKVDDELPF